MTLSLYFSGLNLIFADSSKTEWSMTSRYVKAHNDHVIKSILVFQKGDKEWIYKPAAQPWGFWASSKTMIKFKEYFITSWANGAVVVYRVFEPESLGATLVCEVHSFLETTTLKKTPEGLRILVHEERNPALKKWVSCDPEVKRRSASSVKTKKKPNKKKKIITKTKSLKKVK